MKKRKMIVFAICLLVAAGILSYIFYTGSWKKVAEKMGIAKAVKVAMPAATEQQAGGAAADAQTKSDMGNMNMGQPRGEAPAGEETPTVEIPTDKQQLIGVKTVKAAIMPLQKVIRTVGRIEYDEQKLATVNTKIEGWIEKLYVDYTGRYVKKGEPLAEVYSPELVATQKEFLNTLRWASQGKEVKDERVSMLLTKDADVILEAARERLRLWDISEEQIKQIEQTGKPVRTLTIYSPVSGFVIQKMAIQGVRVMPGEKLFDVVDLSTVWIVSDIYEYELPLIKVGQMARIGLSYFPGKEFSSRVDYVYPSLAGDTRTAKARFTIPNPDGVLKPQMFTNVEIKINLGSRLAVPTAAVIDTGMRQIVYVDKGEGNFEPREVMPGLRSEDMVEIIHGLKAGEKVSSSANFLIDSEAQLKGVQAMPGGHKH
ncbi:MAG TPA: efflux RND transporter periplasmic adaptor subunit [Syntrophales bacterium]|nr:efflux RND transporter periplasmic adaptor subunit [Syntrophales bacterium]